MANTRQTMERFPGQRTGYDAARTYAAALAEAGRAPEAQAILQRQLATLPASERNVADQIRLMLGLIAGEGSVAGRQAFKSLLRDGQRPDTQRLALQLLARGAKTPGERESLRNDMAELLRNPAQRTIHEDLTLALAQSALVDKLYPEAEQHARQLIELYPGSALKSAALGVRLAVAWISMAWLWAFRFCKDSWARPAAPSGSGRVQAATSGCSAMSARVVRSRSARNADSAARSRAFRRQLPSMEQWPPSVAKQSTNG